MVLMRISGVKAALVVPEVVLGVDVEAVDVMTVGVENGEDKQDAPGIVTDPQG